MKTNLWLPASLFVTLMTAALATGNQLLLIIAIMIAMTVLLCLAAVIWASATVTVSAEVTDLNVRRGDRTALLLQISHRGWIPVAPVLLEIPSMSGRQNRAIRLRDMPGRVQRLRMPIQADHVGVYRAGVTSCTVEDLLGIFRRTVHPDNTAFEMVVQPQTFQTEPLKMAPGDPGSEIMARATEDLNAPSDIRAYQPGDAMKKIHWKLSLRKGELIVRKFDEPLMQDVLILMDCSRPPSWGYPQAEADIRDALLETAASLFSDQIHTDHAVRMPLTGDHPAEVDRSMGVVNAFDYLARVDFTETDRFERVLQMESRRLRKVGCVAAVSARLNSGMVDIMIRIHRAGPNVRFFLVTFAPDDDSVLSLVSRLRQGGVEVAYVVPDTGGKADSEP